jgi:hypothetical protein
MQPPTKKRNKNSNRGEGGTPIGVISFYSDLKLFQWGLSNKAYSFERIRRDINAVFTSYSKGLRECFENLLKAF